MHQRFLPASGLIVFSGRSRALVDRLTEKRQVSTGKTRDVWFLDQNGITAMYQRGVWLYQKPHSLAQVQERGAKYIGPHFEIVEHDCPLKSELKASSFAVHGRNMIELPREGVLNALKFEFNLPLPEAKRYGRSQDVIGSFDLGRSLSNH